MSVQTKQAIQDYLQNFSRGSLKQNALALFETLGYSSDKQLDLAPNTAAGFVEAFNLGNRLNPERAKLDQWQTVEFLFQLTQSEIGQSPQIGMFTTEQVNDSIIESYLFLAIELQPNHYTRTDLAQITREVNKQFQMPVLILFKHGPALTFSIINRRLHKRDSSKDVLEKVTVIKDISLENPHRAHIEILFDLSLAELQRVHKFTNFVELHQAWQKTLDTKELNKRFYRDLSHWYFWAMHEVTFPGAALEADKQGLFQQAEKVREHNAKNLIRLLTRLLFVWFIKEKNLIPDELFDETYIKDQLLNDFEPRKKSNFDHKTQGSKYYRAILQNLFFATLNQTVGKREFRKDKQHRNVTNLMRYESYFKNPQAFLNLVEDTVPFMNGGLFECLDAPDPTRKGKQGGDVIIHEDGFSDHKDNILSVPDYIFFGVGERADLSEELGDKKQKDVTVNGLINILKAYKFTVTENTPIEEDIALDPELLGRVFENLLASYNPETKTTARKQTGSFYTPREIVNYMVDESLVAYLNTNLTGFQNLSGLDTEERLRHLLAYNEEAHQFNEAEVTRLIAAIDAVEILDPACGSGAFPMGILHKLVHILHKLDPDNAQWREVQRRKALKETDEAFKIGNKQERDERLQEISDVFERNADDYGRKLYLIENCIYGVDIQPIATQISKLRFFISLIVEQRADQARDNFGIRPLPNLETKFVAANTLIGLEKPALQLGLFDTQDVKTVEDKLKDVRHRLFNAKTPATKRKLRDEDKALRERLGDLLITHGWGNATARQLAAWDPYDQNATSPFFDMEWMFGAGEGFDIVIGNPPYGVKFSDKEKKIYTASFKHQNYQLDSYLLFLEKGLDLVKKNHYVAYIIPNPWLTNLRQTEIRKYILNNNSILNISHYKDKVFDAVVDTEVVILKKARPDSNTVLVRIYETKNEVIDMIKPQSKWMSLAGDPVNIFLSPSAEKLFEKLQRGMVKLGDICRIVVGIKPYQTGKGVPKQTREIVRNRVFDSTYQVNTAYRPLLRGSDISKYSVEWPGNRWIEYGEWLAEPRYSANFEAPEKLLVRQTGDALIAAFDMHQFVCMNNLHVITTERDGYSLRYVLALLNSKLLDFYYQCLNPERGEALAEVKKENVGKLPIKIISPSVETNTSRHK